MKQKETLRERVLRRWGRWASLNWGKSLLIGLAVTAVTTIGVMNLNLEMTFFSMLPAKSSQVTDLKKIMADFPLASGITIVVDGRHIQDPSEAEAAVRKTVDTLETELSRSKHSDYIKAVTAKADEDFFKTSGLLLAKPEDIRRFTGLYQDLLKELGTVAGLGIIGELGAMLIFIPALLGMRHHHQLKKGTTEKAIFSKFRIKNDPASGLGRFITKAPLVSAIVLIAFSLLLATGAGRIGIEDNIMNMEAKGLKSVELQDTLVEEFSMAPDNLFIITDNLSELKSLDERLTELDSVKTVDSAADMLLTEEELQARLAETAVFKERVSSDAASSEIDEDELIEELYRLQMNLLEMSDMAYMGGMDKMFNTLNKVTGWDEEGLKAEHTSLDKLILALEESQMSGRQLAEFQQRMSVIMKEKLLTMASAESASPEDLPQLYRDSYISDDGSYLMSVIPTGNPWEGEYRNIYTAQIESVTDKATGMLLAADQLNLIAESDGQKTAWIALTAIFIILLLIGIGVDDAVHISHRYLIEGKGRMEETIAKIGSAVLLTSVTTIIAFASFIPSIMRAMRSTGIVLSMAIAFAFIFSILLHPSLLIIAAEKLNLNIKPWRSGKEN